jgi:hypothetical protein
VDDLLPGALAILAGLGLLGRDGGPDVRDRVAVEIELPLLEAATAPAHRCPALMSALNDPALSTDEVTPY